MVSLESHKVKGSNTGFRQKIDKVSLFAVVVDFSEPYIANDGGYKMKIKVVDDTYNRTLSSFAKGESIQSVAYLYFVYKSP